jgi:hypothetical protein
MRAFSAHASAPPHGLCFINDRRAWMVSLVLGDASQLSPECRDLLSRIFHIAEADRITIQQIMQHPWCAVQLGRADLPSSACNRRPYPCVASFSADCCYARHTASCSGSCVAARSRVQHCKSANCPKSAQL